MSTIMITVGILAENGAEALECYAQGVIPLLEQASIKILGRAIKARKCWLVKICSIW